VYRKNTLQSVNATYAQYINTAKTINYSIIKRAIEKVTVGYRKELQEVIKMPQTHREILDWLNSFEKSFIETPKSPNA
jgi:archaellum biogenesis ATPase FlaH